MKKFSALLLLSFLPFITSNLVAQKIESVTKEENKFVYSNSIKLFLGDSINVVTENIDFNLTGFSIADSISNSQRQLQ